MKHGRDDIYPIGGLRNLLRDQCKEAGGIRAWCRAHELSPGHISRVIGGHKLPGPKLLMALNLRESTVYVPTRFRAQPT